MRRCFEKILTAPPSWLRPILVPLAFLYAGTAALHRGLYRLGILKSLNLPRPVVSVGNLTAGGGGQNSNRHMAGRGFVKTGDQTSPFVPGLWARG